MIVCPACGQETPEGFPRCANCGAPVAGSEPARRERKVVTVVFADLVGSTATAERLDPEEVDARLRSYHAHVREELERYGGTVEKFIGDAVVALFGAPVAHEDDPERAVRAALAIRDWAREEEELQVRVAVNTGEALVTLGARPAEGEGMAAGDVVNTAARIQGAAPVNGVLVGEATFRATERVISYEQHEPVEAKGKAEPVPVWEALEARSRLGVDVSQESRAPLVGREQERELMLSALERVRTAREPQLVTLIGVPGIGKSRLVYELLRAVQDDPELITWRQGRSLPYGEGVAFWAFAEMVKAQAGILETDTREEAAAKLHEVAAKLCDDDAEWVQRSLRPLVGVAEADDKSESREESFAAWRRLVEGMADERPTVLVFEDLHWADEGLLDFVDGLADDASSVPLLCVCTARPELLERRPSWGGGKINSTTIGLARLSDEETQRLLAQLVGRELVPAELLQFAGGNPLYAEEYARMLSDRGVSETELPETVQGIIAARLDSLSTEEKAAIQNGAILGKVFWSGSVPALENVDTTSVEGCLRSLVRKEFVRRERRSSVGGQDEYAFRHVLVRDVAYGQIPRSERGRKHRLAAEWIEELSARSEDLADLLAHHYMMALEYGAENLGSRARRALRDAGDRSSGLHSYESAIRYYVAALDLCEPDDPERGPLLLALGNARFNGQAAGLEEISASIPLLEDVDPERAAEALVILALLERANQQRTFDHLERARALVRHRPPSREKCLVLGTSAGVMILAHDPRRAREFATESLAIAEELGDTEGQARALMVSGNLRLNAGDERGRHDLERALATCLEARAFVTGFRCYSNLADALASHFGEIEVCFALQAEALQLAERLKTVNFMRFFRGERTMELYLRGRWDEAIEVGEPLVAEIDSSVNRHFMEVLTRIVIGRIALARGLLERAAAESEAALERGRGYGDLQVLYPAFAFRALALLEQERPDDARAIVAEFADHAQRELERTGEIFLPWAERLTLCWLCRHFDVGGGLRSILDESGRWTRNNPWVPLMRHVFDDELAAAADAAERLLLLPEAAFLRLQGGVQLDRALEFYRRAGATKYAAEAEALLAKSA